MINDFILSYPGFFASELRGETLWIRLSGNFFHNIQSFDNRDFLRDYFDGLAACTEFKTVVIHSAFSESGSDEYLRFFLLECPERDLGHFGFSNSMDRYELNRFCNIIDQTILSIMEMDKIVIHICSGDVLSLFMNVSLACDYRIVGSDTVFHNVYQEIGMLPKGAAPYFLRHAIGAGRTKELLLMHQRITARQAFENGIAERIVPPEELESVAADVAAKFSLLPEQTLAGTKRLTNFPLQQFKEYLEFETDQILRIGHRMEFDDQ